MWTQEIVCKYCKLRSIRFSPFHRKKKYIGDLENCIGKMRVEMEELKGKFHCIELHYLEVNRRLLFMEGDIVNLELPRLRGDGSAKFR